MTTPRKTSDELSELEKFIIKAKKGRNNKNAKDGQSLLDGFNEFEFEDEHYKYLDTYSGFYQFAGNEIVWKKNINSPVWTMFYRGEIGAEHFSNEHFIKQVHTFLKEALYNIGEEKTFRGPKNFSNGPYNYSNFIRGQLPSFIGSEKILHNNKKVYEGNYLGGFLIPKT